MTYIDPFQLYCIAMLAGFITAWVWTTLISWIY